MESEGSFLCAQNSTVGLVDTILSVYVIVNRKINRWSSARKCLAWNYVVKVKSLYVPVISE